MITDAGNIVFISDNTSYTIPVSHILYDQAKEALKTEDEETLLRISKQTNVPQKIVEQVKSDRVQFLNGSIVVDGEMLDTSLTRRILEMQQEGYKTDSFVAFLKNLVENPSRSSVYQLYDFLKNKGLPITTDGCFLGYKAVGLDFLDLYSKTIKNDVGSIVEVPRNKVDDNPSNECSWGLHVGTFEYAKGYGANRGILLLVKVNPRDCVSVPSHDVHKLRVCRYEVVKVYEADEILSRPLYDENAQEIAVPKNTQYYDDDEDNESYDWWDSGSEYDDEDEDEIYEEIYKKPMVYSYAGSSDVRTFNRDEICRLAKEMGITSTIEEARKLGKAVVMQKVIDELNN